MLHTKTVGIYTVSQAGMREAVRRVGMMQELQNSQEMYDLETLTALSIYPNIAGCIQPLISIEDFMQMPEQELDSLSAAVMELNPHWFAVPDQEKKTKKARKRPTKKLPTS